LISLFSSDGDEDEVVTLSLEQLKEKLTARQSANKPIDPLFAGDDDARPAQSISLDEVRRVCQQWVHRGVLRLTQNMLTRECFYQNVEYYDQSTAAEQANEVDDESGSIHVKSRGAGSLAASLQGVASGGASGGSSASNRQKLLESYIVTILGFRSQAAGPSMPSANQGAGKPLEKIFSLLNTVYMRGQGLVEKEVKEVLQSMVVSGRIGFIEGRYAIQ